MHFDWTVNLGSLITALGLGSALFAAHRQNTKAAQEQHVQNQKRLEHIETRLDMIYEWFIRRVVNRGMSGED